MRGDTKRLTDYSDGKLFLNLTDQLSRAMLQVARAAEVAELTGEKSDLAVSKIVAEAAMQLCDSYGKALRLHAGVERPHMEAVSVSSLLHETEYSLRPYAEKYGVQLVLAPMRSMEPLVCDPEITRSALVSLGQVFVEAAAESGKGSTVLLDAYKTRHGIVAGLYGECSDSLNAIGLRRARRLYGRANQPLMSLASGPATGVFIADNLLKTMSTKLHVARHNNLSGLAATLPHCSQMQMV